MVYVTVSFFINHSVTEAEEATEFLHNAGLSDLSNLYRQGQEITERVLSDSVRQRNLTEKQAQTVLSRVRTLNKTLCSRQPRRKHRQDVRDVTWNIEVSSFIFIQIHNFLKLKVIWILGIIINDNELYIYESWPYPRCMYLSIL